jgi:hypothetical protein
MSPDTWVALTAGVVALLVLGFIHLWRKAGRELRAMELYDQRKQAFDKAQRMPPVQHLRRLK